MSRPEREGRELPSNLIERQFDQDLKEATTIGDRRATERSARPAGIDGTQRGDRGRFVKVVGDDVRFLSLIDIRSGDACLHWRGRLTADDGNPRYPLFDVAGQTVRAHRWAWEQVHGPLPAGWTLDHLCHTFDVSCPGGADCWHARCVRLSHLEPVPPGENVRRRHARERALRAIQGRA